MSVSSDTTNAARFREIGLTPHQAELVHDILVSIPPVRRLLVAPAGSGKTVAASALAKQIAQNNPNCRILVIGPRMAAMHEYNLAGNIPGLTSVVLNRRDLRELEANVTPGQPVWPTSFAAVIGMDTARSKSRTFVAVPSVFRMVLLESQINGGVIQGISYALYEARVIDRNYGFVLNPNLEQYKILGSRETPEIKVHVIENILGLSSTDAGGIGEPAKVPTAAAVANAVYNAIGVRVREIPMRPATVLAALGKVKGMTA